MEELDWEDFCFLKLKNSQQSPCFLTFLASLPLTLGLTQGKAEEAQELSLLP